MNLPYDPCHFDRDSDWREERSKTMVAFKVTKVTIRVKSFSVPATVDQKSITTYIQNQINALEFQINVLKSELKTIEEHNNER